MHFTDADIGAHDALPPYAIFRAFAMPSAMADIFMTARKYRQALASAAASPDIAWVITAQIGLQSSDSGAPQGPSITRSYARREQRTFTRALVKKNYCQRLLKFQMALYHKSHSSPDLPPLFAYHEF